MDEQEFKEEIKIAIQFFTKFTILLIGCRCLCIYEKLKCTKMYKSVKVQWFFVFLDVDI